ncbi:HAD-IIIA family hydrolase [Luedemannella helvata]|uniref:D,D-heptose 1,7-bisphosphate phosphatase n=1 Tax=Luedemannella helvata TaxID=349315 RepID=A0ABP4W7B9_9ACTN
MLFDRDGTLVEDVPYNGDPALVRPRPGARAALDRLRAAGYRVGVVTNQSGLARGLFTEAQMHSVRARIEELLGPFEAWQFCRHVEEDGCECRKPRPGLVLAAAAQLGVDPARCVVVGDIGADVGAAHAAGAASVLVPTPVTRADEVAAAPTVVADLVEAADWVLGQVSPKTVLQQNVHSGSTARPQNVSPVPRRHVLVVRSDSAGDVLVTGPAIRAVAAGAARVTLLCGPRGRAAAQLLPGVDELIEWTAPWIDPQPPPVTEESVELLVKQVRAAAVDEALIFTSYHQSALPAALLLRLAGVGRVSAISVDYPGSLLDVRVRDDLDVPETERALGLARAAGYDLPPGDDGRLRLRGPLPDVTELTSGEPYVVVHPGASVPARACPPDLCAAFVTALRGAGWRVLITGAPDETVLTAQVAGSDGVDLGGRTPLPELAAVLAGARAVVVGNTGPAHLAAAVGTPVVSLFAPTVPYARWGPYGVPVVRLGDAGAPCRGSRATVCPVPGHPCLSHVEPSAVVSAIEELTCGF